MTSQLPTVSWKSPIPEFLLLTTEASCTKLTYRGKFSFTEILLHHPATRITYRDYLPWVFSFETSILPEVGFHPPAPNSESSLRGRIYVRHRCRTPVNFSRKISSKMSGKISAHIRLRPSFSYEPLILSELILIYHIKLS